MDVMDAIRGRRSIRAYLDRPVDRAMVEEVLETARWAPSGVNAQPWEVAAVTGMVKADLAEALLAERKAGKPERPDYKFYPDEWKEPYKSRRKASGLALFKALGIGRGDDDRRIKTWNMNYAFFGAPVGLLFFLERGQVQGSWTDMGMFLQNVMLAAFARGLGTCPQAALAEYPDIVRRVLGVPESRLVICGMSLGYPDPDAPVNGYRTEREPVSVFTRWV